MATYFFESKGHSTSQNVFKAEDRANLFDMLRRIKTSARQTYTRYGTGSVVMFDYAESPI